MFWLTLWCVIPALLLYPFAIWMLTHTQYSVDFVIHSYEIGIAVLFLPSAFLVDFLYRRFILKKRISN